MKYPSVFELKSEQSVVKDSGDYKPPEFDFRRKISWKPRFQARNLANKTDPNCRNSVQGKEVIADERGFVCDREDILVGGCCDVTCVCVSPPAGFVCDREDILVGGCCDVTCVCVSPPAGFVCDREDILVGGCWFVCDREDILVGGCCDVTCVCFSPAGFVCDREDILVGGCCDVTCVCVSPLQGFVCDREDILVGGCCDVTCVCVSPLQGFVCDREDILVGGCCDVTCVCVSPPAGFVCDREDILVGGCCDVTCVCVSPPAGFVCDREDILVGGCCDVTSLTTRRFTCASCQESGCCQVYEHCVSCCLQPEKQPLLRSLLDHVPDAFKTLFASVTDHFELCLAKCRTSSQSVQHENSYRDPKAKYCYGADPPQLHPAR
ncbi:C12orf49 [Branchiostoma lanceolatum]|uniref:SREBP regulating gene protein n=1 Tax=Branchiostoma lanceolatum TaxID=7740 RepID=A0A8J9W1A1_BRALA|nr:C12orf49 [Branchiostoma lanceolatum]